MNRESFSRAVFRGLSACGSLLQRGRPSRIPVLYYHGLGPDPKVGEIHPEVFQAQIEWLSRRFRIRTLADLYGDGIPGQDLGLGFDDGFASVHDHAFPALNVVGAKATIFLATQFVEQGWPETGAPMLSESQIAEMARHGMEFASHTHSHADASLLSPEAFREELSINCEEILRLTGSRPVGFTWPFGRTTPRFDLAFFRDLGIHYLADSSQGLYVPGSPCMPRLIVRPWETLADLQAKVTGGQTLALALAKRFTLS